MLLSLSQTSRPSLVLHALQGLFTTRYRSHFEAKFALHDEIIAKAQESFDLMPLHSLQARMHMWHSSSLEMLFTVLELLLNGAQALPYPFSSTGTKIHQPQCT